MSVTFKLSTGVEMNIPIDKVSSSKYIGDLLLMFNTNDNMIVDVPDKYNHVFDIYFYFLCNKHDVKYIDPAFDDDSSNLPLCFSAAHLRFNMESYFIDSAFFKYLITEAHYRWDNFYECINTLPDPRSVYLYAPYEYVPDVYIDNPSFLNEWLSINRSKLVMINKNQDHHKTIVYHYNDLRNVNDKQLLSLHVFHTNETKNYSHRLQKEWYQEGNLRSVCRFVNDNRHGVQESWHENGNIKSRYSCIEGKKDGPYNLWYENGSPHFSENYIMDEAHGSRISWYSEDISQNSNMRCRCTFVNGRQHGVHEQWFPSGQIYVVENYVHDERHGIQQRWHENGQLELQYFTINGRNDGLEQQWNKQGILEHEQPFSDGKPVSKLNSFLSAVLQYART